MSKCPFAHPELKFDPLDLNDPFPTLEWSRSEQPVFYSPEIDYWVVTRYDDIVEIEKNKHVFVNSDKEKGGYRR